MTKPTTNARREAAHAYARIGWHVLPIGADKRPLCPHGFKDATTDAMTIDGWWNRHPDANIGIATGSVSGIIVLDVDIKDRDLEALLADLESLHGPLPNTLAARSGGGGRHLYFRTDGAVRLPSSQGKLLAGVDVRGEGGYIIAPPSTHSSGGEYRWLDGAAPHSIEPSRLCDAEWLVGAIRAADESRNVARRASANPHLRIADDDRAWVSEALKSLSPAMPRDEWIRVGMALHHGVGGETGFSLWNDWSIGAPDAYPGEPDLRRQWTSFGQSSSANPVTLGTIWRMAENAGWRPKRGSAGCGQRGRSDSAPLDGWGNSRAQSAAGRPTIVLKDAGGDTPTIELAQQFDAALANDERLFARKGKLVEFDDGGPSGWRIVSVTEDRLRLLISGAAETVAVRVADGKVITRRSKPGRDELASILAYSTWARVPRLERIATIPYFDADWRLKTTPGYDAENFTWLVDHNLDLPDAHTGSDDAEDPSAVWRDLLCDFPFAEECDRAAAVALALTLLLRNRIDGPTPFFLVNAPEKGTGKGLLLETIHCAVYGRSLPTSRYPSDDEELEKMVTGWARDAGPVACFDNIDKELGGSTLERICTSRTVQSRQLGTNNNGTWDWSTVLMGTGNGCRLSEDMTRRTIEIRLDAHSDRPAVRSGFKHRLPGDATKMRAELLAALFRMVTAYVDADFPQIVTARFGSYDGWDLVRNILLHAGFGDPYRCVERLRGQDLIGILYQNLLRHFPVGEEFSATTVADIVADHDLQEAISDITKNSRPSAGSVGRMLTRILGKVRAGVRLAKRSLDGRNRYRLDRVIAEPSGWEH